MWFKKYIFFLDFGPLQKFFHARKHLIFNSQKFFFAKFLRKSMDWFLYDNGLRHERVKIQSFSNSYRRSRSSTFAQSWLPRKIGDRCHGGICGKFIFAWLCPAFWWRWFQWRWKWGRLWYNRYHLWRRLKRRK